jgi:hypothetical protein
VLGIIRYHGEVAHDHYHQPPDHWHHLCSSNYPHVPNSTLASHTTVWCEQVLLEDYWRYFFVDKWSKTGIVGSARCVLMNIYPFVPCVEKPVICPKDDDDDDAGDGWSYLIAIHWYGIPTIYESLACWPSCLIERFHMLLHAVNVVQRQFNDHWCKKLLENTKGVALLLPTSTLMLEKCIVAWKDIFWSSNSRIEIVKLCRESPVKNISH